jgi:hypothetical protein
MSSYLPQGNKMTFRIAHIYIKNLISSYAQFEIGLSFAYIIEGFINHKKKKKNETVEHSSFIFMLFQRISNGVPGGNVRQRMRQSNWSSLGSLNSFGESTTTPPSSQEHTGGSSGSNTNGSVQQRETLHSRFDFKQTLGKGTYGKVKLALDKRKNEQVAIKTIKKSRIENPHDLARIRREIDFMTSLNHPYIIKIKEGKFSGY